MAGAEASQTDDELIVIKNLVQKVKKEKAEAADKAQVGIDDKSKMVLQIWLIMTKIYNTGGLSKRPEKLNGLVKMIENQQNMPPEFNRVVDKMFNERLDGEKPTRDQVESIVCKTRCITPMASVRVLDELTQSLMPADSKNFKFWRK